jgi:hypothetical protein
VVHISPTRTGDLKSSPTERHVGGCYTYKRVLPVPRRDRLRQCYRQLSAIQPSARCLTPWLRWTTVLFCCPRTFPLRDEDAYPPQLLGKDPVSWSTLTGITLQSESLDSYCKKTKVTGTNEGGWRAERCKRYLLHDSSNNTLYTNSLTYSVLLSCFITRDVHNAEYNLLNVNIIFTQ